MNLFTRNIKSGPALIQNKKSVTITFQSHKGGTAGGLFGCRIVKAK